MHVVWVAGLYGGENQRQGAIPAFDTEQIGTEELDQFAAYLIALRKS